MIFFLSSPFLNALHYPSLTPLNNSRKASDCHYSYYLWDFFLHHQSVDISHFHLSCRTEDCILGHHSFHAPVSEFTFICGSITFLLYALVTLSEKSCTWVRGALSIHTGLGVRAVLRRRTLGWTKSWTWPGHVLSHPRKVSSALGCIKGAWPAGWGQGFCPSTLVRPHLPCCIQLWDPFVGVSNTRRMWTCLSKSRGSHKDHQRPEEPLLWGQTEIVWVVQPEGQKALGRLYCDLFAT